MLIVVIMDKYPYPTSPTPFHSPQIIIVMHLQIDDEVLGRNAQTVFRNREDGRKRNILEENNAKDKKQKEKENQYAMWGKGLVVILENKSFCLIYQHKSAQMRNIMFYYGQINFNLL